MCIHMSPRRMLLGRVAAQLEIAIADMDNSVANIDKVGTNIYGLAAELLEEVETEIELEDASVIA